LYNTDQLDIKISFVITRLEVFTAAQNNIDKKGGEIEGYLVNCLTVLMSTTQL
jgi:hypothetical protein